jgi:hypothetical protein
MLHDDLICHLQAVRTRAQRARAEARQLKNQYEALQAAVMKMVKRGERVPVPVEQPVRSDALANTLVTVAAK